VIEVLDGVGAQIPLQPGEIALQPRRRGQGSTAAEHRGYAAEGAAKPASERRLIGGGAPSEKRWCEIGARVPQEFVGQHGRRPAIGERPVLVMDRFSAALPRHPVNLVQVRAAPGGNGLQELRECRFSLPAHEIVHIGRVDGGIGIQRRKIAAPYDGHPRRLPAYGRRSADCRAHLRSSHDGDSHRIETPFAYGGADCLQVILVDIAIDDPPCAGGLERSREREQRKRKASLRPRRDLGIDQQYVHMGCLRHLEDCQFFVDEAALSRHGDFHALAAKLLQERIRVSVARQQHQRIAAWPEVRAQAGGKSFSHVG
jgi:hypothetical protein